MKTIAKLSLLLVMVTTLAVFTTEAQPGYGKEWRGHDHSYGRGFRPDSCRIQLKVEDLSKVLSLTEDQKNEILKIHYAHMEEMKSISEKYQDDCVGEHEARIASRKKTREAVEKILTDEQQEKFDDYLSERGGPHGHRHRHW